MSSSISRESELIRQIIEGDEIAFRQLYERYQRKVFLFALRLIKSATEAEEIVQEVFVRIWEKRAGVNADKNFNAFILTITKNLVIDKLKKAARDRSLQYKIYHNMDYLQNEGVNQLIDKELARLYHQAIESLSPRKRQVYLMSREEELTYEEIAERLGLSKNTIRNQMSESLITIREFLSRHPDIACVLIASIYLMKLN